MILSSRRAVLMYHGVTTHPSSEKYNITERAFEQQLQSIVRMGYQGCSLSQARAGVQAGASQVILTFDDGHITNHSVVLPLLKRYGFTATFFVTTSWMSAREGYMSWEDVGRLGESGMDVQIHGRTHRFLDTNDRRLLEDEIGMATQDVFRRCGIAVDALSFPGGRHSRVALEIAWNAGLWAVATSEPAALPSHALPQGIKVPRMVIQQSTSPQLFESYVSCDRKVFGAARRRYVLMSTAKKILGNALYQRLWDTVSK